MEGREEDRQDVSLGCNNPQRTQRYGYYRYSQRDSNKIYIAPICHLERPNNSYNPHRFAEVSGLRARNPKPASNPQIIPGPCIRIHTLVP